MPILSTLCFTETRAFLIGILNYFSDPGEEAYFHHRNAPDGHYPAVPAHGGGSPAESSPHVGDGFPLPARKSRELQGGHQIQKDGYEKT